MRVKGKVRAAAVTDKEGAGLHLSLARPESETHAWVRFSKVSCFLYFLVFVQHLCAITSHGSQVTRRANSLQLQSLYLCSGFLQAHDTHAGTE